MNRHWRAAALCLGLLALGGCAGTGALKPVGEQAIALDGVTELTIAYDEENVTFVQGQSNRLILREYMSSDKERYHANISHTPGRISIREGARPLFSGGFVRRVEVELPTEYNKMLTVTTTNGTVDLTAIDLHLTALRIDSTEGEISLGKAEAGEIHITTTRGAFAADALEGTAVYLESTSGRISCNALTGAATCKTTSGELEIGQAQGFGTYRAENSGRVSVCYAQVEGDVLVYNKNGEIQLTLPKDLAFQFIGTTKNGTIVTDFAECVTLDGRTSRGVVGDGAMVNVEVETKNGNAQVDRK